jgi:hypothetical protein
MTRFLSYIVLLFLLTVSCIEPYWPDLEGQGSVLVVDALITDDPENIYVILSLSAPVNNQVTIPVTGAHVFVTDNMGNTFLFKDSANGKYLPSDFAGIAESSYMLTIILPNGKQYFSDFQQLKTMSIFDSIHYEIESQPTINPRYPIEGARFYLDNIPSGQTEEYCLFQLIETYKYHVDFRLEYTYYDNMLHKVIHPPPMRCWKTDKVQGFFLYKNIPRSGTSDEALPIHFISFDTKQFSERYSILVKQICVSEEIFNLYSRIDQQNNNGSTFAIQPYNIVGNVKCAFDPEETVFGSFIVGGIKEKRAFFSRPRNVTFTYSRCSALTEYVYEAIAGGGTPEHPLYLTVINGELGLAEPECFLCSESGGTSDKPDFWED